MGKDKQQLLTRWLCLQELQNSILDLNRQLDEAKARENTMLAVERQHKADIVSMTAQMDAAEQKAADAEHRMAGMATDYRVRHLKLNVPHSFILKSAQTVRCCLGCKHASSHHNVTSIVDTPITKK